MRSNMQHSSVKQLRKGEREREREREKEREKGSMFLRLIMEISLINHQSIKNGTLLKSMIDRVKIDNQIAYSITNDEPYSLPL